MSTCNHDCSSCQSKCEKESLLKKPHQDSSIKKIIGVVSGKGGVGKSLVTSLLAVGMQKENFKVGILDADITGPSIPKIFGVKDKLRGTKSGLLPNITSNGIKIISSNLLLKNDTDPVLWRGPIIANLVSQFWTDVIWQDVDYLFIDMPPGTGDVALTVFQSISIDGIIIVTSPQELVEMIVEKAVKMANMMKIPILGLVENMSYFECENCHRQMKIFGDSQIERIATTYQLDVLAKIPLNPQIAFLCDQGKIEEANFNYLDKALATIKSLPINYTKLALPLSGELISDHFTHCEAFLIIDSLKQMIIKKTLYILEDRSHEGILEFLQMHNVNVVLTKNIGQVMYDCITSNGISVYTNLQGKAHDEALKYLRGELDLDTKANCSCKDCSECSHDCK